MSANIAHALAALQHKAEFKASIPLHLCDFRVIGAGGNPELALVRNETHGPNRGLYASAGCQIHGLYVPDMFQDFSLKR
jgi:hypothetical protein